MAYPAPGCTCLYSLDCAAHPSENLRAEVARLSALAEQMAGALERVEAALRVDSRQKSILSDTVEYHLDGQTMYQAITAARAARAAYRGGRS
jgi:hypothetical protein